MEITVFAHPNSKKPRIETDLLGALHIYVSEPPLEGRANEAVAKALAGHYKIKKYQVELVSGAKSKHKVFRIL
jgi:uncharacterized protein (TIGR00251 family)